MLLKCVRPCSHCKDLPFLTGEDGYVRLVRGKNMCGLADGAMYPTNASAVKPIPPPSPPTPAPPLTHYGNPKAGLGCLSDEDPLGEDVTGVPGSFCAPRCEFRGAATVSACPLDLPTTTGEGVTAQCLVPGHAADQDRHCVLDCDVHGVDGCPKGASCKDLGVLGICTYDGS